MKPYIITIARQYGSGGKTVGKMLSDRLHIPFYNREIITMASEDSGINAMLFTDERLKPDLITRLKSRYKGNLPLPNDSSKVYLRDDALFDYQAKIIRKLADQGPCVLIGRCADYVLKGRPDGTCVCACGRGFLSRAGDEGGFAAGGRGRAQDCGDRRISGKVL